MNTTTQLDTMRRLPFVMDFTGYSKPSIYRKIKDGSFPAPLKMGSRAVAWKQSALVEWQDSLEATA